MIEKSLSSFFKELSQRELPIRFQQIGPMPETPELILVRDDTLPLGFGTKLRKIQGILSKLGNCKSICIVGSIHSNFLASFVTVFHCLGYKSKVFAFTKDATKRSANRCLVEYFANDLRLFSSRKEALLAHKLEVGAEGWLPEFGFMPEAVSGLQGLWEGIENSYPGRKTLFLEIGSGLSFLSAQDFFSQTQCEVQGLCIGESKSQFVELLLERTKVLGLGQDSISLDNIHEQRKPYAKRDIREREKAKSLFKTTGILFDPLYAMPMLEFLTSLPNKEKYPKPWLYLHQGGQINFLNFIGG
ncbi:hypothetical protein LPTSP4_06010 [Leptospira ryugenii]|uniref:1-aminocyclopropane-1-carboxylate deaminase n=2 Tax=Leptospira ryugenii TaxID=1917863 RepID=A0A2P2DWS6_9LEPT|nr:hypothetical protein LPTSP4_06010 [Leptospira ryugenii]